ncbi:MAG: Hsp70 family protein [Anaerolineaceae bacterium]|nr:Hsp70 family protein [Anaerolineaceae bacterium]
MSYKVAIDFGTTNSVVATWNTQQNIPEVIALQRFSSPTTSGSMPLIPSLLYVHDAQTAQVSLGQTVRDQQLDYRPDNRLFRNFKRGIVAMPAPPPRLIDGVQWADRDSGRSFVRNLLAALPFPKGDIEQLVLTSPVASFEGYLTWLNELIDDMPPESVRIVDESTAAALGYMVTEPKAVVLVFDFGGGTLDLSLVQLPESREKTGGFLGRMMRGKGNTHSAKVIAKAGRIIGGSDIDQWLLAEVLKRTGLSVQELGSDYAALLTVCENAKIALSTSEAVDVKFEAASRTYSLTVSRVELEQLLEANGFYSSLRHIVDKVMHVAHRRGIFTEDIHYVLMVGGISLMPSVQQTLREYFSGMALRADKPFTAIVEGALQVAAGYGLEDYLAHSYGIRHLDPVTGKHEYDEIIPAGSPYPLSEPIEVLLGAAHNDQAAMEFMVAEIDSDSFSMLEVNYEGGQAVFVAQVQKADKQIVPINAEQAGKVLATLLPPGQPGKDRIKAFFNINDRRQLRLNVIDIKTNKLLIQDAVLATLR